MSETHVAGAGEHLARIAAHQGLASYVALWEAPANAELKRARESPHLLAAGDVVTVPVPARREVDRPTEARHQFRIDLRPLALRLRLRTWDGRAEPDEVTAGYLEGQPVTPTNRGDGEVALDIEPTSDRCWLRFGDRELLARIGQLQPVETPAGVRQRLENLGYFPGPAEDPTDLDLRSAIEEFQCDQGLVVDGKVGSKTRAALRREHGC